MAKRFGATPFAEILPPNLAMDAGLKAAADSLDRIIAPAVPGIASLLIYARLGNAETTELLPPLKRVAELCNGLAPLPEELLDMLAWQFHVDGYEAAYDYAAKERMIWQSLMLHRRKGTPWAVRNALTAAFGNDAGIDEWFNYGGDPYFFRAWLDVTGLFWDQEATPKALRLIREYKNVRSWLEYLLTRSVTNMELYAAIGLFSETRARCRLYFPPVPAPDMALATGVGMTGVTWAKPVLYMPPQAAPNLEPFRGAAFFSVTSSRLIFRSEADAPEFSRMAAMAVSSRTETKFIVKKEAANG